MNDPFANVQDTENEYARFWRWADMAAGQEYSFKVIAVRGPPFRSKLKATLLELDVEHDRQPYVLPVANARVATRLKKVAETVGGAAGLVGATLVLVSTGEGAYKVYLAPDPTKGEEG